MNAKIWGAIAVALVLGACGAKQEEEAAPVEETAPAPAAEEVAPPADPMATDPAAVDPAAPVEPAPEETTPPSQ